MRESVTAELGIRHALRQELGARAVDAIESENDPAATSIQHGLVLTDRMVEATMRRARTTITGEPA